MFLSFSILQLLALVFKQKDALEDECEAGQNTEFSKLRYSRKQHEIAEFRNDFQ